ncbi:hypothetical protein GALMADRAFT_246151 [Galerina marginata CBS 339.88]|uniref:Uncharacterized protein n=1 Tax=Galerina marginata (strain CBS 339.88) TaxID=685588 RepID=A0A067T3V5_GALM3|nr:hypothetical protein GALMADRAFT_246151 [Galerina marginata CBS 339.88]
MPTFPLIVAQYELQGHKYRQEHWLLAALEKQQTGHIFQLIGNTDTFAYEASIDSDFPTSQTLCGGCLVGSVDSEQLAWVKSKLKEVPVRRNSPEEFDCQNWVMQALRLLKYSPHPGVEITEVSESAIREELKKEKEKWETGEETLEDRILNDSR